MENHFTIINLHAPIKKTSFLVRQKKDFSKLAKKNYGKNLC